jgi:hypothetical protein
MPTIASLAGQSYTIQTMGRDLFDTKYDDKRGAFTIRHGNNPFIGMVFGDYYFLMHYGLDEGGLHVIASDTPTKDVSKEHPELAEKLRNLTKSYYKTAQYMLYHNKRPDSTK